MHASTEKEFLITGHPRSGTGYATLLMELAGYDVGHERMRAHGISSWVFAVPDQYQWWEDTSLRGKDYTFNKTICIVRDPLKTLSSVLYTETMSLPLRAKHIDFKDCRNPIEQAAKSIIEWYQIILVQEPDFIFRLEDPLSLFKWLHESGYTSHLITTYPKAAYNARKHPDLDLDTVLESLSAPLRKQFLEHVVRFRYTIAHRNNSRQ